MTWSDLRRLHDYPLTRLHVRVLAFPSSPSPALTRSHARTLVPARTLTRPPLTARRTTAPSHDHMLAPNHTQPHPRSLVAASLAALLHSRPTVQQRPLHNHAFVPLHLCTITHPRPLARSQLRPTAPNRFAFTQARPSHTRTTLPDLAQPCPRRLAGRPRMTRASCSHSLAYLPLCGMAVARDHRTCTQGCMSKCIATIRLLC